LPLNARALEVLHARAKVHSIKTDCVFFNEAGNPRDARNLLRAFYTARTIAKVLNFRFHDLRHSWATRLVQNGVDLYTMQKLKRWRRTVAMVMRYAHHSAETLRPGIEVLDRLRMEKDKISTVGRESRIGAETSH
jgi:integrase